MRSLLLVLLTTLSMAFASSAVFAQHGGGDGNGNGNGGGGGGMGMNPEARIVELIAQLEVTDEQEAGFREAMKQIQESRMANMRQGGGQGGGRGGDGAGGGGQRMERQAEMQKQAEEILGAVLSAAQIEKYTELEQARMAEMMERRNRQ